ncbi:hypothetical protein NC651_002701 [Populus alba x Populus x berolinensis]|nr:hypothetical protein NC651_002701 [Populus alba x Populus x berolinensis]
MSGLVHSDFGCIATRTAEIIIDPQSQSHCKKISNKSTREAGNDGQQKGLAEWIFLHFCREIQTSKDAVVGMSFPKAKYLDVVLEFRRLKTVSNRVLQTSTRRSRQNPMF